MIKLFKKQPYYYEWVNEKKRQFPSTNIEEWLILRKSGFIMGGFSWDNSLKGAEYWLGIDKEWQEKQEKVNNG